MYNPTVGRWMEEDPIDFKAGDADKYRYVENDVTNFIDLSGLQSDPATPGIGPLSLGLQLLGAVAPPRPQPKMNEESALRILKAQIAVWKGKGWGFPAALLQHFIDKKGPAPYTPSERDIEEVKKESRGLLEQVIEREVGIKLNSGRIKAGKAFDVQVGTSKKPAEVRWGSDTFPYTLMDLAFVGKDVAYIPRIVRRHFRRIIIRLKREQKIVDHPGGAVMLASYPFRRRPSTLP